MTTSTLALGAAFHFDVELAVAPSAFEALAAWIVEASGASGFVGWYLNTDPHKPPPPTRPLNLSALLRRIRSGEARTAAIASALKSDDADRVVFSADTFSSTRRGYAGTKARYHAYAAFGDHVLHTVEPAHVIDRLRHCVRRRGRGGYRRCLLGAVPRATRRRWPGITATSSSVPSRPTTRARSITTRKPLAGRHPRSGVGHVPERDARRDDGRQRPHRGRDLSRARRLAAEVGRRIRPGDRRSTSPSWKTITRAPRSRDWPRSSRRSLISPPHSPSQGEGRADARRST